MYERADFQRLPAPFGDMPLPDEPLHAIRFVEVMDAFLERSHALAGTCAGASCSDDMAWQDLRPVLALLVEYLEGAREFFDRWKHEKYPGPTIPECPQCGPQKPD